MRIITGMKRWIIFTLLFIAVGVGTAAVVGTNLQQKNPAVVANASYNENRLSQEGIISVKTEPFKGVPIFLLQKKNGKYIVIQQGLSPVVFTVAIGYYYKVISKGELLITNISQEMLIDTPEQKEDVFFTIKWES